MSSLQPITLSLDRRILEHPRAYHLRRMRAGLWLYLDLLAKLQRALKDKLNTEAFEAALKLYSDEAIRKALAGALAPPDDQIRRSRTALFLYLLKHHTHAPS